MTSEPPNGSFDPYHDEPVAHARVPPRPRALHHVGAVDLFIYGPHRDRALTILSPLVEADAAVETGS